MTPAVARVWSRAWPAPAKLNLFLHVTGLRADGMHWIQTQFQLLDHCDYLDFRVRDDGWIRLLPERHDSGDDLVVRAAALLQRVCACPLGADIALRKRIPTGGGLGGGSSDAATVLMALDRLWGLSLGAERLGPLAAALGSDVPLFIHGHSARAEGTGELLHPCESIARHFLVLDPGTAVSTATVYGQPELRRDTPRADLGQLAYPEGRNDCTAVTCRLYPEVGRALAWLRERADGRMTGTGGCLYAAFDTESQARQLQREVPAPWQAEVARGIAASPLLERLCDTN